MSKEEGVKLQEAYEQAEREYKEALVTEDKGKIGATKSKYKTAIFELLCYRADRIYEEYYSSSLGSTKE